MDRLQEWWRRAWYLLNRRRFDAALREEMPGPSERDGTAGGLRQHAEVRYGHSDTNCRAGNVKLLGPECVLWHRERDRDWRD